MATEDKGIMFRRNVGIRLPSDASLDLSHAAAETLNPTTGIFLMVTERRVVKHSSKKITISATTRKQ